MARSDEAEWWFTAVYEAVQEIPRGKVTSYGHIARLLGRREPHPGAPGGPSITHWLMIRVCCSGVSKVCTSGDDNVDLKV